MTFLFVLGIIIVLLFFVLLSVILTHRKTHLEIKETHNKAELIRVDVLENKDKITEIGLAVNSLHTKIEKLHSNQ